MEIDGKVALRHVEGHLGGSTVVARPSLLEIARLRCLTLSVWSDKRITEQKRDEEKRNANRTESSSSSA